VGLRFSGHANHAGTTPMHLRHDALAGAAEWIAAVERRYLHGKGIIRRRADGVAGWFVAVSKMTGVESSETYRPNFGVPARFGRRPPLVRQASVLSGDACHQLTAATYS